MNLFLFLTLSLHKYELTVQSERFLWQLLYVGDNQIS